MEQQLKDIVRELQRLNKNIEKLLMQKEQPKVDTQPIKIGSTGFYNNIEPSSK